MSLPLLGLVLRNTETLRGEGKKVGQARPASYTHPIHSYLVPVTHRLQNGIDYWFPSYQRSVVMLGFSELAKRALHETGGWWGSRELHTEETHRCIFLLNGNTLGLFKGDERCIANRRCDKWSRKFQNCHKTLGNSETTEGNYARVERASMCNFSSTANYICSTFPL